MYIAIVSEKRFCLEDFFISTFFYNIDNKKYTNAYLLLIYTMLI